MLLFISVELEQPTTTTSDSLIVNNIQVDTVRVLSNIDYTIQKRETALWAGLAFGRKL